MQTMWQRPHFFEFPNAPARSVPATSAPAPVAQAGD